MAVYGKSFSLRFASILDHMSDEIAECTRLLEEIAKEAKWKSGSEELEKDTLVLSDSRSGNVALLPLSGEHQGLRAPKAMWIARLSTLLSANLPEDYGSVREAVEVTTLAEKWELEPNSCYTRSRETRQNKLEGETLRMLGLLVGELKRLGMVGKVPAPYGKKPVEKVELSILSWIVEAFRIVRGYP